MTDTHTDAQAAAALDEAIALIAASACTRTWGHTDDGIPCSACRKEAALLAGQLAPIIRRQAEAERDELFDAIQGWHVRAADLRARLAAAERDRDEARDDLEVANAHVGALRARMAKLAGAEVPCTCQAWPPEGLDPACAVHGAIRALNEASVRLAEVERDRDEARALAADLRVRLADTLSKLLAATSRHLEDR